MSAFEGFSDAHGQTRISAERRAGKQSANSYIKKISANRGTRQWSFVRCPWCRINTNQ